MRSAGRLAWWIIDRTLLIITAAYLAAIFEAAKVDLLGYTLPNLP